jgi:hypothetical protein
MDGAEVNLGAGSPQHDGPHRDRRRQALAAIDATVRAALVQRLDPHDDGACGKDGDKISRHLDQDFHLRLLSVFVENRENVHAII